MTLKTLAFAVLVSVVLGSVCLAGSDVAGVITLSGNADTLAASPSNTAPVRRIKLIEIVSTGGLKNYEIKAGTTSSGTTLFSTYLAKDNSSTAFAAGTTGTLTFINRNIRVPTQGLFLLTDDTSTSGAIRLETREDGTE